CRAFAEPGLDAIVTVASGCGAHLKEYENAAIAAKVIDISQFLDQCADFSGRLKPLSAHVCLHAPCSLKNVMREEQGALNLLRQIPELRISQLSPSITCCGAAGSYVLKYPKVANSLVEDVLNAAIDTQADYLVTSNIGCALHIAAGLREKGLKMQVVHPLFLLAQKLI
ncbi:MAG TPA: heterodisulfide reductase-related iron-sulfur binding cluster, partial [Methylomicrobium sp.]|nr:heterodisulfide reductase-related iron-sulfur binding cluster [Methylomicrobium sp.]